MARIQQSIEIRVPVQAAYNQLTQFEEYPRFMEEVSTVQQLDDTHLHWTTSMANRPVEWDAEITEQVPDRCIAWRNISGPTNAGMVEVQPVGADASLVTFTLESKPEQVPGSAAGESEGEMARRLKMDLARLKEFMESHGSETGAWRGEVHDAQSTMRDGDAGESERSTAEAHGSQDGPGGRGNSPVRTASYAAGSEGFSGDEEPAAPVTSASKTAAELRNASAGSTAPGKIVGSAGTLPASGQVAEARQGSAGRQQAQQASAPASGAQGVPSSPNATNAAGQEGRQEAVQPTQQDGRPQPGSAVVGAAGGTDASAGARMSGSKGVATSKSAGGMPDSSSTTAPAGGSEAAGAAAVGGSSLGGADVGADAGDTRSVPREGTTGAAGGTTGSGSAKP